MLKNGLSRRQNEIIKLVAQNYSNKQIAQKLFLSESTVKSEMRTLMTELNALGRVQLAIIAYKKRLIKF